VTMKLQRTLVMRTSTKSSRSNTLITNRYYSAYIVSKENKKSKNCCLQKTNWNLMCCPSQGRAEELPATEEFPAAEGESPPSARLPLKKNPLLQRPCR
jgi:hypothetical protein